MQVAGRILYCPDVFGLLDLHSLLFELEIRPILEAFLLLDFYEFLDIGNYHLLNPLDEGTSDQLLSFERVEDDRIFEGGLVDLDGLKLSDIPESQSDRWREVAEEWAHLTTRFKKTVLHFDGHFGLFDCKIGVVLPNKEERSKGT